MKFVKELIGKCGAVEVDDCIMTARGLVEKGVIKDGVTWQFVYGGSHGGFIAAHRELCSLYLFLLFIAITHLQ